MAAHDECKYDLVMSVNLSGKQFAQSDLITDIKDVLARTELDPRCLKLEITESVVMENIETAVDMLDQLRALGITLSIDDFGTGYSSLSYLHRFPLSTLKIDRSFVSLMLGNNENSEIVRTIVMLAQNLGMDVVAEGVETDDQLAVLRAIGCKYGQGYLFSRPIPASQAAAFLAVNTAPTATVVCNVTVSADAGIDLVPNTNTTPPYDAPPKGGIDLHIAA
jgi:EAL domain-containing protein (putative c-di-GMP-specific phosphodiesterase class I)